MLTDKIHVYHPTTTEDGAAFSDSLSSFFRDQEQCQHGTEGAHILYNSDRFGAIDLSLASVEEGKSRKLFAHYLWNAELYIAERISEAPAGSHWSVADKNVLELGAGLGLGGFISTCAGARRVTITDYPTPALLHNIRANIDRNLSGEQSQQCKPEVQPHLWGDLTSDWSLSNASRFDRILVADCLWMPEQHRALAQSIVHFLSPDSDACALVVAGFHSGRDRMAPFYDVAASEGLKIVEIIEEDVEGKRRAWLEDRGDENVLERKRWLAIAVLRRTRS